MPTLCMLGDSHIAAMRAAWKTFRSEFPDLKTTTVAAPGTTLRGLAVSDGRLVAGTDALAGYFKRAKKKVTTVEPDFDIYLTCGLGLQLSRGALAIRTFVTSSRDEAAEEVLVEGMYGALRQAAVADTFVKLRQITRAPIGAVPAPMQGERRVAPLMQRAMAVGAGEPIARAFAKACERITAEHDVTLIPQAPQTLTDALVTTRAEFATQPVKFFVYDVVDDMRHMNLAYGEIMMRKVLDSMLGQTRVGQIGTG